MPSIFPFVEKEGKYFASITQRVPNIVVNSMGVLDRLPNDKIETGTKGTYAKVRFVCDDTTEAELFAVNSEFFASSN